MRFFLTVLVGVWVLCCVAQTVGAQTYINPTLNGGAVITEPGENEAPIYVNPTLGGGYVATEPGARTFEPPVYIRPMLNGGAIITQPGAGMPVLPREPVVRTVPGY